MSMNVRGVDNETQDIINFYIANGWEENEAFNIVKQFKDEMYNTFEILCLCSLMKLLNTIYVKGNDGKVPNLTIVSQYPNVKISTTQGSPIMGLFSVLPSGRIYVEIRVTDGERYRSIDWIEFAEVKEGAEGYDKFIKDLATGESSYLMLKDGTKFQLSNIKRENLDWYINMIAELLPRG